MPEADAFIVEEDKFIAVGNTATILAQQSTDDILIDLEGNFVIPGFNDAHIHIWKVGNLMTNMLDLRGVESIKVMQEKIAAVTQYCKSWCWAAKIISLNSALVYFEILVKIKLIAVSVKCPATVPSDKSFISPPEGTAVCASISAIFKAIELTII